MTTLPDLSGKTHDELVALVLAMQVQKGRKVTFKVAKSGGLSVYGLGRFPVTLYASQWERLFDEIDAIKAFLVANGSAMTRKA